MLTRREIVTGGALGALSASVVAAPKAAAQEQSTAALANEVAALQRTFGVVDRTLGLAFLSNTLAHGHVPKIREAFTLFMRTNSKFPDFCEIGMNVFYDLYDWHIRHKHPLEISRTSEGRFLMRFMFTTMVLRQDQELNYIGIPFDRQ